MRGVRLCREHGIKVGLRFTITQDNAPELPDLLQLMRDHEVDKFYLSHLNYAGRGNRNRNRGRNRSGSNGGGRTASGQQEGNDMTEDDVPVGFDSDFTRTNATVMSWNLMHTADLLRRAGVDPTRLPPLVPTGSVVGTVQPAVAASLGLRPETAVVTGLPDLHTGG